MSPEVQRFAERAASVRSLGPSIEELGDAALLATFKLRDRLVAIDANHAACRIDEVLEHLEAEVKALVRGEKFDG
jgi:hypothetical protein